MSTSNTGALFKPKSPQNPHQMAFCAFQCVVLCGRPSRSTVLPIELVPSVVRTAGDLAEVYGLRGFNSIHLASALWLKEKASTAFCFAVFDQRLRAAADRAGLVVVP